MGEILRLEAVAVVDVRTHLVAVLPDDVAGEHLDMPPLRAATQGKS